MTRPTAAAVALGSLAVLVAGMLYFGRWPTKPLKKVHQATGADRAPVKVETDNQREPAGRILAADGRSRAAGSRTRHWGSCITIPGAAQDAEDKALERVLKAPSDGWDPLFGQPVYILEMAECAAARQRTL